ncbi:hypothetical protein [Halomonas sp. AOP35-4E-18]|uniref:hypothetical protein n=1 Tax=Halomonas sp. AOP35-4E-18 TaxID=3457686 RepID=UPI004033599A
MLRGNSMRWGWRVPLALVGSIVAAMQTAWLLARLAPLAEPLDRLYAGLFIGVVVGQILLLSALLAPSLKHVVRRLAVCLLPLTSLLLLSLGKGG